MAWPKKKQPTVFAPEPNFGLLKKDDDKTIEQLQKLANMKAQGVITDAEFTTLKHGIIHGPTHMSASAAVYNSMVPHGLALAGDPLPDEVPPLPDPPPMVYSVDEIRARLQEITGSPSRVRQQLDGTE